VGGGAHLVSGEEIALAGGFGTPGVVRVGATVRRPPGENAAFVHALLRHLERVGFTGAPRLLGLDEAGREILTFVEGEVVHDDSELSAEEAVALIDWDTAAPGRRIGDLDHAAWFYARLTWGDESVAVYARRVEALCRGYGWPDPAQLLDELEARLERCRAAARAGGRKAGEAVFGERLAWMAEHGRAIRAAL
jgi:hypothetical protein